LVVSLAHIADAGSGKVGGHRRSVVSTLPETMRRPSGLNATLLTASSSQVSGTPTGLPVPASQTRTVGTNDRVAPPMQRVGRTKAGQRAQLREYPVDHFDVYQGTWQQRG
jgi:hypothetical protein